MHFARLYRPAKHNVPGGERPYPDHVIPQERAKPVKARIMVMEIFQPVIEGAKSPTAYIRSAIASIGQKGECLLYRLRAARGKMTCRPKLPSV